MPLLWQEQAVVVYEDIRRFLMCWCGITSLSGVAAFVLQVSTSKGTGKDSKRAPASHTLTVNLAQA